MGETNEEAVDVISDAIEAEVSSGRKETEPEPKEVTKPEEPKAPVEPEKGEEEQGLEEPKLPEEPAAVTPEDHLRNYRDKLTAGGFKNQAEQGERWYKKLQEDEKELEELRKIRDERNAEQAETAKQRSRADDTLEHCKPELKPEWGTYRQKFGDRAFLAAYDRYLEDLRKESPDDYERETIKAELREQKEALKEAQEKADALEKDRARREFLHERDTTLRSLQVDPKDFDALAEETEGSYVVQYMKLKADKGIDAAEGLRVSEVAKLVVAAHKAERERIRKEVQEELLEEARENKKKKAPRKRAEEPVQPKGRRAKDIDDATEEVMKDAIVESMEGK